MCSTDVTGSTCVKGLSDYSSCDQVILLFKMDPKLASNPVGEYRDCAVVNGGDCSGTASVGTLASIRLNDSKAGMDGLDVDKINKIIDDVSRGSKFFQHKQEIQKRTNRKIEDLRRIQSTFSAQQLDLAQQQADALVEELESSRDLSRWVVHVDMDAFYAAVEMRDNPSLRDVPMAVGSQKMLSTSNYAARRYGVRAGMPGFIARKLCPHLVIVAPNFDKYRAASQLVQDVLRRYDPDVSMVSLDEGYLDLTEYVKQLEMNVSTQNRDATYFGESGSNLIQPLEDRLSDDERRVAEIVERIRGEMYTATNLTASAGIACNGLLAKICSDHNKPNGQFLLRRTRRCIETFMCALALRKVSGIGPVTSQLLEALSIKFCGQLLESRAQLQLLFSATCCRFLIRVSLGVDSSASSFAVNGTGGESVSSMGLRKSISCERTLERPSNCRQQLQQLVREQCRQLSEELCNRGLLAGCVGIKLKTDSFDVRSRSEQLPQSTSDELLLVNCTSRLLRREMTMSAARRQQTGYWWRLVGVRVSSLTAAAERGMGSQSHRQSTLDWLMSQSVTADISHCTESPHSECGLRKWSHQNQTEQSFVHVLPDQTEFGSVEGPNFRDGYADIAEASSVSCPVCDSVIIGGSFVINAHLDECLSQPLLVALQNRRDEDGVSEEVVAPSIPERNRVTRQALETPDRRSSKLRMIDEYFLPKH